MRGSKLALAVTVALTLQPSPSPSTPPSTPPSTSLECKIQYCTNAWCKNICTTLTSELVGELLEHAEVLAVLHATATRDHHRRGGQVRTGRLADGLADERREAGVG